MTRPYRQIITLAVEFDLSRVGPPDTWDWGDWGNADLGLPGVNKIEVLASGQIKPLPTPMSRTTNEILIDVVQELRDPGDSRSTAIADRIEGLLFDDAFDAAAAVQTATAKV